MIALGIDLLEIDRIRRSLENPRFVRRVFGAQELEQLAARGFPAQSAAAFMACITTCGAIKSP